MADAAPSGRTDGDIEQRAVRPSIALIIGIALISWAAIALVFGLGRVGLAAAGGVGSGARGLAVWVMVWIAMWAAVTVAVTGGLAAGLRAWIAVYSVASPQPPRPPAHAGDGSAEARRAVAAAEDMLRRDRA